MKVFGLAFSILCACLADSALAETIKTLCDNCDETAYRQVAQSYGDRYGNYGDYVLVTDVGNGMQRRFFVGSSSYLLVAPSREDAELLGWATEAEKAIAGVGLDGFCGPGFLGDTFVWDGPDGAYGAACQAHDQCYEQGGNEEDRAACDYDLYWSLRMDAGAGFGAVAYFSAVRRAGALFFNYHGNSGWYQGNGGYYGGSTGGIWGNSYVDPRTGIIPLSPPPRSYSGSGWNGNF